MTEITDCSDGSNNINSDGEDANDSKTFKKRPKIYIDESVLSALENAGAHPQAKQVWDQWDIAAEKA